MHGTISFTSTIRPEASQNAIESGIRVSFIQNAVCTGPSNTNTSPELRANEVRPIRPARRSDSVFATSKNEVRTSPPDVWKVASAIRCWDVAADVSDREQPGPTTATSSTRGRSRCRLTPPGYGARSTRM
jgi:hypothetical protein